MRRAASLVIAMLLSPSPSAAEIDLERLQPGSLDTCDELVQDNPEELAAFQCYTYVARQHRMGPEAARRLDAYLSRNPDHPAAQLQVALILFQSGDPARVESLLHSAVRGFRARGHEPGLVSASASLAMWLRFRGRHDESIAALDAVEEVVRQSGDPELIGTMLGQRAWHSFNTLDYGRAWSQFKELEALVFPDGPTLLKSWALSGLGSTMWAAGRFPEALEYYRREAKILRDAGLRFEEVGVRYNIGLIAMNLGDDSGLSRAARRDLVRGALDAALRTGNRQAEAETRLALTSFLDGQAAVDQAEQALRITREIGDFRQTCWALRVLSRSRFLLDPSQSDLAVGIAGEALALARSRGDLPETANALLARADLHWDAGSRKEALTDQLEAIEVAEKIRNLQPEQQVRARTFSRWTAAYYRALTMILDSPGGSPETEEIGLAFNVAERLRSRAWLDELDAAQATSGVGSPGPLHDERAAVLRSIAEIQKKLIGEPLALDERDAELRRLGELEDREEALRVEIARDDRGFRELYQPTTPSLGLVQRALAPEQALLAYHVPNRNWQDDRYRAWLFVVTHDDASVVELPTPAGIEHRVAAFLGLLERRDRLEARAAARLYSDLLEQALRRLPERVSRLVIVPDGPLMLFPFGTLRVDATAEPVAARYEVSISPSASTWLHLEQATSPSKPHALLSLADPPFPNDEESIAVTSRAATWFDGLNLSRLPYTRREAKRLVRSLGGTAEQRSGEQATEAFLKDAALRDFAVLHLATHTVVDDERPERTAVVLAAGAEQEDGLLQVREVVELELDHQLVILSGCSSASGPLLPGEGVLGLARAFFLAGARSVVGSLWPLRDDEAARLVQEFAEHLSRGQSVGAALSAAQRESIRGGQPGAAWAGLVVLGDAELVPFPRRSRPLAPLALGLGLAAVILLAALLLRARARRPTPSRT